MMPDQYDIPYKNVAFDTCNNLSLNGWWFSAKNNSQDTIVFVHGNAGNVSTHSASVYWLTNHGYNVFVFDYRGFGMSEGETDLTGSICDIQHAINWAGDKTPSASRLIVMGHSLGASMLIYTVANNSFTRPIDKLVLLSAFSDYRLITREVLSRHWLTWSFQWPFSLTINNDYRPLDYIGKIHPIPVLFMHGKEDYTIPSHHSEDLYNYAKEPKSLLLIEGGHNGILSIPSNREAFLNYLNSPQNE